MIRVRKPWGNREWVFQRFGRQFMVTRWAEGRVPYYLRGWGLRPTANTGKILQLGRWTIHWWRITAE